MEPIPGKGGVAWIPVGGPCNSRCSRCPGSAEPAISADQARSVVEASRPCVAVITGPGEPTIRGDLDSLFHAARRGGAVRVALVTNGRMLSYERVAARIASLGPSLVAVSVLHHQPEVHDRACSVPGAFEQSMAGIRSLAAAAARGKCPIDLVLRSAGDAGDAGLRALAKIAVDAGAGAVWIDGTASPGEIGFPVIVGEGIEARLLHGLALERREAAGHVQARMHEDEKAVSLVVRTGCRNACVFCTTRIIQESNRAHWPLDDLGVFEPSLAEGRARGYDLLRLVAMEPLEHPDIEALLDRARALGYAKIEAWTSARALTDAALAARLAGAGLTAIDVPLFGPDAAIHDSVAGVAGSFDETMRGLGNARGLFDVAWHLVVTRQNVDSIAGTVSMALDAHLGDPRFILLAAPSTPDPKDFAPFAARLSDVARSISRLSPRNRTLLVEGGQIPPCVVARFPGLAREGLRGFIATREGFLKDFGPGEAGASQKLRSPCPLAGSCRSSGSCSGYHALYAAVHGTGEFEPL